MRSIDTKIFIDIIENEGCIGNYSYIEEDVEVYRFISKFGKSHEYIILSEEYILEPIAIRYLRKLELEDLIEVVPFS